MSKNLTVRELLNGESKELSPMDFDTAEIRDLSNCLPKDGNIDINQAEILATRFLRGADVCSELLAVATNYACKTETLKKKAYSEAALTKATAAGCKTDKSKMLFADADSGFIEASNKYSEALAFVKWITSKHESFIRAHYLCKKLLDRNYAEEKANSWTGSVVQNEEGEFQTTRQAEAEEKAKESVETEWWNEKDVE